VIFNKTVKEKPLRAAGKNKRGQRTPRGTASEKVNCEASTLVSDSDSGDDVDDASNVEQKAGGGVLEGKSSSHRSTKVEGTRRNGYKLKTATRQQSPITPVDTRTATQKASKHGGADAGGHDDNCGSCEFSEDSKVDSPTIPVVIGTPTSSLKKELAAVRAKLRTQQREECFRTQQREDRVVGGGVCHFELATSAASAADRRHSESMSSAAQRHSEMMSLLAASSVQNQTVQQQAVSNMQVLHMNSLEQSRTQHHQAMDQQRLQQANMHQLMMMAFMNKN
jgi:hypothetical protein